MRFESVRFFSPVHSDSHAFKLHGMHELIIADGLATDIQMLVQDAPLPVMSLGAIGDPLQALTTALAGERLEVLHIVAHGRAGGFQIGGQWVDRAALQRSAHLLAQWQVGRIALWVCELGQDPEFAATLARLTGADVLVSAARLGWDARSGARHWRLQAHQTRDDMDGVRVFGAHVNTWNHQLVTLRLQGIYATTASGAPDGFYGEETSSVTINTTPLSTTGVTFSQAGIQFSGNNVLGTVSYQQNTGDVLTFGGLASRPIKVGGVIKGFYVWLDNDSSGAGSSGDTAFILSLDNSYFNANTSIGSSSDRVDSAMNSVLPVNSAPTAINDAVTVSEDAIVTGNVLTNDTDGNGDALTVTGFTIGGVAGNLTGTNTITGVGTLALNASGVFSFEPLPGYTGSVPVVRYTVSDGNGGTSSASLSFTITPVNDAPSGVDKTVATRTDASYTFSAADFALTDLSDSPANTLAAVKISTLPATGTLSYNGTPITQAQIDSGFEVLVANLGKLTYTPGVSSPSSASFTFQVRDNGGTANGGVDLDASPNAVTFDITQVNHAPVTVADLAPVAVEIGWDNAASQVTTGTNPMGFVLGNDADADGNMLSVASVINTAATTTASAPSAGSTKDSNPASALGLYGTLKIGIDGSYVYEVDNANAAVQALRTSSDTLTEIFTYTASDGVGGTSTSTLTVTIQGANDRPIAVNDANVAKEHLSGGYDPGFNTSGNVRTNDTDVDAGDTKTVTTVSSPNAATATGSSPAATTTTITLAAVPSVSLANDYVFYVVGGVYTQLKDAGGTGVQVSSNSGTSVVLNKVVATVIPAGATLEFYQQQNRVTLHATGTYSSSASVTPSQTVTTSSEAGTIVVGMSVIGDGVPAGTTVTGVDAGNHTVTLSNTVTLSGAALSFSNAASAVGTNTAIAGKYGVLQISTDGSYSYTASTDMTTLSEGEVGSDTFNYTMRDTAGATSSAVLTITVLGSGTNDPKANADVVLAVETGAAAGQSPSGNVITGTGSVGAVADTTPVNSLTVTQAGVTASTTTAVGANTTVDGAYGRLTISSDGTYSYGNFDGNAAVNALRTSADTLTETFFYRVSNGVSTSVTTLTITIQGANDAPVGVADTASATEAGGIGNGTVGVDPTGNLLGNDTDVDTGDTRSVSKAGTATATTDVNVGTTSANGLSVVGAYGTLKLGADGSYTYTVNQDNATVQALLPGSPALTDTFTYELKDAAGATHTATLTVSVQGANDAPTITLPGSAPSGAQGSAIAVSGISVSDVDGDANLASTKISVDSGTLTVNLDGGAVVSVGANGSASLTLSGTAAQINAALATLSYAGNAAFNGADKLVVTAIDDGGLQTTQSIAIEVSPDARPLTVTGTAVNEASPFVLFTVGGAAGQLVTLSVAGNTATAGTDFISNLQYYDGSSWQPYTGEPVPLPGTTLLVRLPVLQDSDSEGVESLQLTASNSAGIGTTNASTVADNGSGVIFLETNTTGVPDTPPGALDDDRPLSVNSITVNEASSHAVFEVTGSVGQVITLDLAAGSATVGVDYANALQVWNGVDDWVSYGASTTIPADGKLFVRVALTNDGVSEGPENFGLKAINGSGIGYTGTAIIVDDGTGLHFDGTLTGGVASTSSTGLDNDLSVSVSAYGPVNEGSTYAMFAVTATIGENLTLAVAGSGSAPATTSGFTLQYSYDGTTWLNYSETQQPTVPGTLGTGTGVVYVRANIASEQDSTYEGAETFSLSASTSTGAGTSASAETTIIDDGTGSLYDGTLSLGTPNSSTAGLDNDMPTVSVGSVTVGEASPFAVVAVTLSHPSLLATSFTPALANGSATGGTDFGSGLQYFDGTGWSPVTGSLTIAAGSTSLLLRVAITSDDDYEGAEDFTISTGTITGTVTNSAGASGTVTIKDDGSSSNVFLVGNNSATPTAGTADDDRPTVGGAGIVLSKSALSTTEAGAADSFTVKLNSQPTADVTITLTGLDCTEGSLSATTLTFTPANWNTAQTVTVTGVDDLDVDGDIAYTLTATSSSTDGDYVGKTDSVNVTNADNDAAGLVLSSISAHTTEAGGTATFTVKLSSQPTTDVTVTLTGLDATEGSLSATTLTFTSANWNTAQTVTVTGVDDPDVDGNISYTLSATSSSTDGNYAGKTGSVNVVNDDNDVVVPPPTPTPEPEPPFSADLDPDSDTGVRDNVTMVVAPEFALNGGSYLSPGGSARLLDSSGQIVGASSVTAADIQSGTVNVPTRQLDDGEYTFQAQILDAAGRVLVTAPVTVTIVTDRDGIMPSVELAANNGDYNQDGTPDWQQNNLAQLPLMSVEDFQAGTNAPAASFGAIIAGSVNSADLRAPVVLDAGAQLLDLSISAVPAPLPADTFAASAMFNFSVTAQTGSALTDIAPDRPGLQTQVVIDLPSGITANAYLKYNALTGAWTNFVNAAALDGSQDGAVLLDLVGDGKVHRVVITLTDGGPGDEDGIVNGVIVDPGLLAYLATPQTVSTPVYSVLLASGDRFYTTDVIEAAGMSQGTANVFEGVRFDSLEAAQGGVRHLANYNPFTADWYFAVDGGAMPYACYEQISTLAGFSAAAAGIGPGQDFHLYLNRNGLTQLVTEAEAATLGLAAKGYVDHGAVFNTTTTSAFTFDPEAYLVANHNDDSIVALVQALAGSHTSVSDARFIEAVEQHYLTTVSLIGTTVAQGGAATAADLNAVFGTHFVA